MSAISISTPGSPKPVVRPKPIGVGVSLGEMEIQQLNAGGHARCLEELQFRGDAVDAQWCEACRLPLVACICEAGVSRTSAIPITHAKMVQLVIAARCASYVNIDFFKLYTATCTKVRHLPFELSRTWQVIWPSITAHGTGDLFNLVLFHAHPVMVYSAARFLVQYAY